MQIKVGGDELKSDWQVSTEASKLTTYKLHWNIVISNPGAKYLVVDVKNEMAKHEYYKIALSLLSQYFIDK